MIDDNFPPGYHSFETDNDRDDDEINLGERTDEDDDSADYRDEDEDEYVQDELLA